MSCFPDLSKLQLESATGCSTSSKKRCRDESPVVELEWKDVLQGLRCADTKDIPPDKVKVEIRQDTDSPYVMFEVSYRREEAENSIDAIVVRLNSTCGEEYNCVHAVVRAVQPIKEQEERKDVRHNFMDIKDLFYYVNNSVERANCDLYLGSEKTKGAGKFVINVLTNLCTSLLSDVKYLQVDDVATFFDFKTAPYFKDAKMTPYLRLLRGYGWYEGLGFFAKHTSDLTIDEARVHQQRLLDFHHQLFTSPLNSLPDKLKLQIVELEKQIVDLKTYQISTTHQELEEEYIRKILKKVTDYLEMRKGKPQYDICNSMREILTEFDKIANKHRPTPQHNSTYIDFSEQWRIKILKVDCVKDKFLNAASVIALVESFEDDSFASSRKLLGSGVNSGKHLVVNPPQNNNEAPKVEEKLEKDHHKKYKISRVGVCR
jgi:hypothetical protein